MSLDGLEDTFRRWLRSNTSTAGHLWTLRAIASHHQVVAEFGVLRGASSAALLLGARERVHSWDTTPTPEARDLARIAGDRWVYTIGDSRAATLPDDVEMLFIDSRHTYDQMRAELAVAERHPTLVRIVFHDTITFGTRDALGETGQPDPTGGPGIRLAIDEFMIRQPRWVLDFHDGFCHGLLGIRDRGTAPLRS